jgi:hypothetical protein
MSIYVESCGVCGFQAKSLNSLARHVEAKHKEFNSNTYYDKFMKKDGDGVCVVCGEPTKYRGWSIGYWRTCGHKCGGILHRKNLMADPDKRDKFLEKMRVKKINEWKDMSEERREAITTKLSNAISAKVSLMTTQERLETFSRYYKCDEATIERLNKEGRDQCVKNWKAGVSGYGVNSKMAYKGRFVPQNPSKYDGDPTGIIYRSQWECRFMSYLDSNSGVIKWSSEEIVIPYYDKAQNKWRRYFPDFCVVVKQGSGTLTQLIEIKPFKECTPPVKSPTAKTNRRYIKESLTYVTNQCKWKAAESFAADRNWKFKVITERDMGILTK